MAAGLATRFEEFLAYRSAGKSPPSTVKAYQQDFAAIAAMLAAALVDVEHTV